MKLPYRLPARNLLSLQAASPSKFTRNAHTRRPLPTASHTSVYSTLKRPASRLEGLPRHTFTALQRPFHTSQPRRDIFFVAFPALKAHLLSITRFTLVLLPFVWRYRVWKKYPRTSLALLQIPIFAVCIVVALALDQSPRTHRWRLLMMSTHEEMEWAQHRFQETLAEEGPLLVFDPDPRVQQVKRIIERLIAALDDADSPSHIVSAPAWPPRGPDTHSQLSGVQYKPSARAVSAMMPFRLESSNPNKVFADNDWKIYVVDLPRINAFALPTREIVIYTGLIDLLEDDRLLSAVLSHEIAHVTQRHAVENAGFMKLAEIAFDILRGISYALTISFPVVTDAAGSFLNLLNDHAAPRAYSRKLEIEADAIGLEYMAKAGYDPQFAIDLWDVMAAVEEDAAASGQAISIQDRMTLLRTHPTSLQRQKNIQSILPKAMELYRASLLNPSKRSPAPLAELGGAMPQPELTASQ